MKTILKTLAICMMAGALVAQSVYAEPLVIQEQGSFLLVAPSSMHQENLTRKSHWTLLTKLNYQHKRINRAPLHLKFCRLQAIINYMAWQRFMSNPA